MSSIVDTPYSTLSQPKSGWQLFNNLAFGKISDTAWRTFTGGVLGISALAAVWRLLQS